MAKTSKDYFGLGRILSLILAIIPVTAWILGVVTRFKEGKIVAAIIRLVGVGAIIFIVDFICMLLNGRIWRLLNI
jgi:hypothetical protein